MIGGISLRSTYLPLLSDSLFILYCIVFPRYSPHFCMECIVGDLRILKVRNESRSCAVQVCEKSNSSEIHWNWYRLTDRTTIGCSQVLYFLSHFEFVILSFPLSIVKVISGICHTGAASVCVCIHSLP